MKIGIVVHSQTGNTYSVVQKLQDKLSEANHSVNIERLIPLNEKENDAKKINLETIPNISGYDELIFCGPVRGFSISPVLAAYLSKITSLENKKVALLVTQFFPFPIMGGNQTIKQMKNLCESKKAIICGTGIVNWSRRNREEIIEKVVENFSKMF